ncbi:3263_t:CDS:2, partial [Funneliformis mosseae]
QVCVSLFRKLNFTGVLNLVPGPMGHGLPETITVWVFPKARGKGESFTLNFPEIFLYIRKHWYVSFEDDWE